MNRNCEMEDLDFIPFQYPKMCPMMIYKTEYRMEDPEIERNIIPKQQQPMPQAKTQPIPQPIQELKIQPKIQSTNMELNIQPKNSTAKYGIKYTA